ncbi:hypothetical protein BAE44_0018237 [Dichanthelium oligosanthes]|uniref:Uncharacterized protein n=1 Tax=Dichanthelium oligosanthes TaxID=888268 RepID=A0A1E5V6H2_9POAL|nr:hypothetical protein BAE44_0018237 [Dichanthelium oligosanthes]
MESSSHKRAREAAADLAVAGEGALPEAADAKRLRPEDLLDMLDDDTDAAAAGDLASVMRSLEEEIASFDDGVTSAAPLPQQQQLELGFLLEASDDELGLPPAGASSASSEEAGAAGVSDVAAGLDGQIWGFEDEIDGGFGGYSPEAAAAAAASAAWDQDDGFDAGLFAFGDDGACGPSDLAALRHETMPTV